MAEEFTRYPYAASAIPLVFESTAASATRSTETASFASSSAYLQTKPQEMMQVPKQTAFEQPDVVEEATIAHVDRAATLLNRHLALFNGARERLLDTANTDGPGARLLAFFEDWKDDPDVKELLAPYVVDKTPSETATGGASIFALPVRPQLKIADLKLDTTEHKDNDASALFKLSRHAMDDFHALGGQRNALERLKRRKLVALRESLKRSAQLEQDIAAARVEYANLDRTRLSAEEDYGLVRGLMGEQLQAVDDAFVERMRLLSNPVSLCYVRVTDLPVRIEHRATPLISRVDPGQLPAACDAARELPERLAPFLELLADQPMSAWRVLADKGHRLPPAWVYQPPEPALPDYTTAIQALPVAFRSLARTVPAPLAQRVLAWSGATAAARPASQAALGRQAVERITLERLINVRVSALRVAARRLQDDLSRALACLLGQLASLPAADRFAWSRLAEEDHLAVDSPASWPGFEAHLHSSAGLNLRLIVNWLYAQLAEEAPAEARAALRTTLRACLLQAVNDDPAELLAGDVVQFPGAWKPGVMLGATLNRIPQIKAPLRVYDASRRLIAEARVADSQAPTQTDEALITGIQAQVEIVRTYIASPMSFTGWTLVG
jgi:hypothetical protein